MSARTRLKQLESSRASDERAQHVRQARREMGLILTDAVAYDLALRFTERMSTVSPGDSWTIDQILADAEGARLANALTRRMAMLEEGEAGEGAPG